MTSKQKNKLTTLLAKPVQWDCSMRRYTSFSVGGTADAVVKVGSRDELQQLLSFLEEEDLCWRVIGKGTNLLVRDEGFAGVIVLLSGDFEAIVDLELAEKDAVHVQVGCGCGLGRLGRYCIDNGFSGLEFTTGIPGSVGGAVLMNAGAWGQEMATVIKSVSVLSSNATIRLDQQELDFSYRYWPGYDKYQGKGIIVEAVLELKPGDADSIKEMCRTILEKRKKKQPAQCANAGSFFKNPQGDSAGRLIEASGLKGKSVGGAMISEHHANFLVNTGKAKSSDILTLMKIVQEKVAQDCGINLEPEVHIV